MIPQVLIHSAQVKWITFMWVCCCFLSYLELDRPWSLLLLYEKNSIKIQQNIYFSVLRKKVSHTTWNDMMVSKGFLFLGEHSL